MKLDLITNDYKYILPKKGSRDRRSLELLYQVRYWEAEVIVECSGGNGP